VEYIYRPRLGVEVSSGQWRSPVIHIGGAVKIFFRLTKFFHPKNLVIHTIYIYI
jgi:hypothetical protein